MPQQSKVTYRASDVDVEFFELLAPSGTFNILPQLLSFNMFLFQHSTLAWWAAVIGGTKQVGVYGPWRSYKKERNKNLSHIPLPGWFQWE